MGFIHSYFLAVQSAKGLPSSRQR